MCVPQRRRQPRTETLSPTAATTRRPGRGLHLQLRLPGGQEEAESGSLLANTQEQVTETGVEIIRCLFITEQLFLMKIFYLS